jgi:hypothetical protein
VAAEGAEKNGKTDALEQEQEEPAGPSLSPSSGEVTDDFVEQFLKKLIDMAISDKLYGYIILLLWVY